MRAPHLAESAERGATLIEMLIALVVLSIGILAVGQMFPAAQRSQLDSRLLTAANYYAQQKIEYLSTLPSSDANLTAGRHPAGSACDSLGPTKEWLRYYQVTAMASPLSNLKRIEVTVSWQHVRSRSVIDTTYLRQ